MEKKRKRQREARGGDVLSEVGEEKKDLVGVGGEKDGGGVGKREKRLFERRFRQNEVRKKNEPNAGGSQPTELSRVLSKIF